MLRYLHPADLRIAALGAVVLPMLALFGIAGYAVLATLEAQLEARLEEDIALIARSLKRPVARSLQRDRANAMDEALRSAFDFGRVYGAYVYDADGELLGSADPSGRPRGAATQSRDVRELAGTADESGDLGDYRSFGGLEVFSYFTPLTGPGGQVIGMLQITREASEMRDYLGTIRAQAAALLAFSALLLAGIIFAGHHLAIGRPLARLAGAMEKVARGDRARRASPSGPREIRQLGERFNRMLEAIEERDRRLASEYEKQQRLARRLRESEKYALAGRLAAGVAHELGTPLSVIEGQVQRLLRGEEAGSRRHSGLTGIREAAQAMARVVRQLLGFGHGTAKSLAPCSPDRILQLAAADVRALYEESGTCLDVESCRPGVEIAADKERLREALVHLLRNAHHAARGGAVRLGCAAHDQVIRLYVEDSGPGIAEADRRRIFEPFFTTKRPGEGSGLGLAVVRSIVNDHDGNIRVYEAPAGGAGFALDLPVSGA